MVFEIVSNFGERQGRRRKGKFAINLGFKTDLARKFPSNIIKIYFHIQYSIRKAMRIEIG
jgi:hypothetical protein